MQHGKSVQRPESLAASLGFIGSRGVGPRLFGDERDDSIDLGIRLLDSGEVRRDELSSRELLASNA